MKETSQFFNWIMDMSQDERFATIDNLKFTSYPYEKYGGMVVAMKIENGFNYQVLEIANEYIMGDASRKDYTDILPTLKYFGERIALSLNLLSGKTNEEIKQMIKKSEKNNAPQHIFQGGTK